MNIQKIFDKEEQYYELLPKIKCKICNREFEQITSTHLKTHSITMYEYREQFPDALLISESCRKKLSGENHHFFGKHHTEESKQRQSEAILGKPSPTKGRHKTKEQKQKIREARLGTYHTDEAKQKISAGHRGEKNGSWKGGISFEPYCIKFDDEFKDRVRDFFNGCCYVCGIGQSELCRKLDVHHVNYDKMVCCNDVKPLFVPLCHSCHGKTQKDRKHWEEFFTVSLEYLTDGECFLPKSNSKNFFLKQQ